MVCFFEHTSKIKWTAQHVCIQNVFSSWSTEHGSDTGSSILKNSHLIYHQLSVCQEKEEVSTVLNWDKNNKPLQKDGRYWGTNSKTIFYQSRAKSFLKSITLNIDAANINRKLLDVHNLLPRSGRILISPCCARRMIRLITVVQFFFKAPLVFQTQCIGPFPDYHV